MEKLLSGYTLQELIENRISQMFGVNGVDATVDQIYKAIEIAKKKPKTCVNENLSQSHTIG